MAIYLKKQYRLKEDDSFKYLTEAFHEMTEEERDTITAVHPLLDGCTVKKGAKFLCVSEATLHRRLKKLLNKFPLLDTRVKGKNWNQTGGRSGKIYSGREGEMEEFAETLGLDPMEYEFLRLIHPIFDVDMTREQACKTLGWSEPTGLRIWNSLLERFPDLGGSMGKWVNPMNISRHSFDNPKKFGDFDDPYFGEDKIVRKF